MRALWHLVFWPALGVCIACIIANYLTTFLHSLAEDLAEYAEKKLRAHRGRA